ncbi:extracellular solute-binding protein [Streptomyces sp. NPDC052236]|uniref:extracellular solute-binding protein n=1 Tax=Streptomyces sp. NPDC052236 TaxID=3365686 RepID=UPI0037CCF1EF
MSTQPLSRRFFLTTAAAGAVAVSVPLLSACGSSGPGGSKGGSKTLQVWALQDEAQNPIQRAAITHFNKSSESKLKLVPFASSGSSGYSDKLRVGMGSSNAPDLIFNWGAGSLRPYVEAGQIADLTAQLEADATWKQSFLPSVLDAGKIDGKYYGIPLRGMQTVLVFYNKTMFEGFGKEAPKTYDDILALVDFFKSKKIQPFALGAVDQWPNLVWIEYLVDRIGGASVFENIAAGKEGAWRDPAVKQALEKIQELVERGAFGTNFASVNYVNDGAGLLFARGKAAMHVMGTWEYTNQLDKHPEFAKKDLAFAPFPSVAGGKGDPASVVGNPTNYFSVNKKSADVDAAVKFLKDEMASATYVDALIKAGDVPAVAGLESKLGTAPNPEFGTYVYQMVQKAPSFTLSWDQALSPKYKNPLLTSLQKVFLKQMTPDQFIDAMEKIK